MNHFAVHMNTTYYTSVFYMDKKEKLKSQWDPLFTHQIEQIQKFKKEQCWWVKVTQSCPTLWTYSSWNSPSQNTGVGSLSLLQGTFSTQGSNPGFPHCGRILYQLSHKESPRILEWVAYPFSSRSSRPRNSTGVSCIAGRFFTNWATREAPNKSLLLLNTL